MKSAVLVSTPVDESLKERIRAGRSPQRDFFALAEALHATLICPAKCNQSGRNQVSKLLDTFRIAWAAFRRHREYDLVITDLDRVGVALSLLFKLTGVRKRLILICHGEIVRRRESLLVKLLRLQTQIDRYICYSPSVSRRISEVLGVPQCQLATVRHAADHSFWSPVPRTPEKLITSAGLFRRDYATLIEAVRGLEVSLVVAAYSPWMATTEPPAWMSNLPSNVRIVQCSYEELREFYARSLAVAIPLLDSSDQAGSLVMYEAMAMGKAVVATRTQGLRGLDVVRDGETGLLVNPGDVEGWREAIVRICGRPEEAVQMGRRARALVEQDLNLDTYVRDVVGVVREAATAQDRVMQRT